MTDIDYRDRYRERLAAWAAVFPPKHIGIPNVDAEFLESLERTLEELRETGRPIPSAS